MQHVITEHGSSSYMRDEQNDSANEEEANADEDSTNAHSNMSDITNIQMQLDNIKVRKMRTSSFSISNHFRSIEKKKSFFSLFVCVFSFSSPQQQMNAMQKTSISQQKDDEQMKVPKLTLKLSKSFQKSMESEQSSTESDSGSDNDNDNEEEENDTAMQGGMSNEMNSDHHQINRNNQTLALSSAEHQEQLQQHEQYPYDANDSLFESSDRFTNNANESESTAKNPSIDSDGRTTHGINNDHNKFATDVEQDTELTPFSTESISSMPSIPPLPLAQHELHFNDELKSDDTTEQGNLTVDTNNVVNASVSIL